jgi:DNA polymerase III subunit delta'
MQFNDIIGHKEVKGHLADMVQQNRLSHALLFLGKEGNGALCMALAFAQYVVCEKVNGRHTARNGPALFQEAEPVQTGAAEHLQDSCGECAACVKAKDFVHPDIHFSFPVITKKSGEKPVSDDYIQEWRRFLDQNPYGNAYDWLQTLNAENKQGNITAEECNEILRKLNLKSFESQFKIVVMWMPEYLGNAGNKLLKLIEEPPADTLFILVGENEALILPTILSRCQLVKIPALSDADVEGALVSRAGAAQVQARQIAVICEGNYREALRLMQHTEENWHEQLRKWLNAILKNGPVEQVRWIDEISKQGREKQKQFLLFFNHILEQSIRLRILGEQHMQNVPEKEMDFMLRLNRLTGISQQNAIIGELDKASYYIERNAHAKMLFHALTIKLYHIIRDNSMIGTW